MTVTPILTDLLAMERRLDHIEYGIERLKRGQQELIAQLKPIAETAERTDATVTQIAWTLDRLMTHFEENE